MGEMLCCSLVSLMTCSALNNFLWRVIYLSCKNLWSLSCFCCHVYSFCPCGIKIINFHFNGVMGRKRNKPRWLICVCWTSCFMNYSILTSFPGLLILQDAAFESFAWFLVNSPHLLHYFVRALCIYHVVVTCLLLRIRIGLCPCGKHSSF